MSRYESVKSLTKFRWCRCLAISASWGKTSRSFKRRGREQLKMKVLFERILRISDSMIQCSFRKLSRSCRSCSLPCPPHGAVALFSKCLRGLQHRQTKDVQLVLVSRFNAIHWSPRWKVYKGDQGCQGCWLLRAGQAELKT